MAENEMGAESTAKGKFPLPTNKEIQDRFESAVKFNTNIGLYDTVEVNEDFYIGDQWKGVNANGLPTPTYNMLKQVVNFLVATASSENLAMKAEPLPSTSPLPKTDLDRACAILTHQFDAIIERNAVVAKIREFMRNAAVDGDACLYSYFDPTIENGQTTKGEIVVEVIENVRVHFGNPNSRNVQKQPYIIISKRELLDDVRYQAEQLHKAGQNKIQDVSVIVADKEKFNNEYDNFTEDKVTVLTYMFRNRDTGTIWFAESTENGMIRDPYDSGYKLYPITWICWDKIHDCYHGRALITGLIPNQKFINKMFAMVGLSMISTAFPKIVYDKTKVEGWDGSVGAAIGVNGPVDGIAKVLEGAPVNPQIAQFIEMAIEKTRAFMGASDVALGDARPDNTSAIIALQRASSTPMEMTKQDEYQCVDDMGKIWTDIMAVRYGERSVSVPPAETNGVPGMPVENDEISSFDFDTLQEMQLSIKHEVGASSYWSEMASMQTMDNLLMQGAITPIQYLERLPSGYVVRGGELINELKAMQTSAMPTAAPGQGLPMPEERDMTSAEIDPVAGRGNGELQRAIANEGVI